MDCACTWLANSDLVPLHIHTFTAFWVDLHSLFHLWCYSFIGPRQSWHLHFNFLFYVKLTWKCQLCKSCLAWISYDCFKSFSPLSNMSESTSCLCCPATSLLWTRVVILIGWLSKHSHNYMYVLIIMRNFSGIVVWYSADRIPGILAWSSNIKFW